MAISVHDTSCRRIAGTGSNPVRPTRTPNGVWECPSGHTHRGRAAVIPAPVRNVTRCGDNGAAVNEIPYDPETGGFCQMSNLF